MPEYGNIDQALAGLQYGTNARIDSAIAQENIAFGAPVMGYDGVDGKAYNAHQDMVTVTINQALALNDVLNIVINGTTFSKTGTGTSDTDMVALKNAINADAAMIAAGIVASLTGSSAYRVITLKAMGLDLVVTSTVTAAGSDGLTSTVATSQWSNFLGVALFAQRGGRDYGAGMAAGNPLASGGSSYYDVNSAVNIMNFGRIWVPIPSGVTVNSLDAAYLIWASGATQGSFTNVSSGNKSVASVFITSKNSQNLAVLEIRSVA